MTAPTYTAADRAMRAVYDALACCPALLAAVDTDTIRDALAWNDANGDYSNMSRAQLVDAFNVQRRAAR